MNYQNILALGFLLLSAGYFFNSLQPAGANNSSPLGMANNNIAYQSFSGDVQAGQTLNLLSVPSDKVFIITMAIHQEYWSDIYEDNQLKMEGDSYAAFDGHSHKLLVSGNGQLPISAGSTLKLVNSNPSSSYGYYIEGYYAEATNAPFASYSGELPSSGQIDLLTVPSDKVFIVTGFSQNSELTGNINIYEDNTIVFNAFAYSGNAGMGRGNGHLVIAAGSTLRLQGPQIGRSYFLQGYYAEP